MLSEQYVEVCRGHFENIDRQFKEIRDAASAHSALTYEIREKLYNGICDKVDSLHKWRRATLVMVILLGLLMGPQAVRDLIQLIP